MAGCLAGTGRCLSHDRDWTLRGEAPSWTTMAQAHPPSVSKRIGSAFDLASFHFLLRVAIKHLSLSLSLSATDNQLSLSASDPPLRIAPRESADAISVSVYVTEFGRACLVRLALSQQYQQPSASRVGALPGWVWALSVRRAESERQGRRLAVERADIAEVSRLRSVFSPPNTQALISRHHQSSLKNSNVALAGCIF